MNSGVVVDDKGMCKFYIKCVIFVDKNMIKVIKFGIVLRKFEASGFSAAIYIEIYEFVILFKLHCINWSILSQVGFRGSSKDYLF